ncbi:hypothetical protein [Rhodoferax sp.]|uniref:hypothetical protein n=1 Tax=Rhodoferax sp. TaxID=50421 RepID=UPI00284677E3|nr:hypothetical protein [Rhodoferax sp.]MDR3370402.1 hypothetical protein [Rhodoferax sp.]
MIYLIRMPDIQSLGRGIGCSAILVLLGCSTSPIGLNGNVKSNAKADVRIQICLPAKRIYFNDLELDRLENHPLFTKYSPKQLELAPKVIRRVAASSDLRAIQVYGLGYGEVLTQSGHFSDSSGFMPIKDSTVANQPVYERGYGYPAQDYVAIHVRLPDREKGPEGNVTYWFTLPKTIPDDKFTVWLNPVSMEPDSATGVGLWWKLTHGGKLALYPVQNDPPKLRVTLQNRQAEHKDPTTDTLPALTTARLKYRTASSDQQFVYEFVPKSNEAIPACD